ncbi:Major facilitator superfamily and Major facilitator superfamily domain, general substrate transporter and Major facilitator superfamily associated domain-containing protein [Strongyloides ratti]|uniref:Major facilitator superfamily and Major facilitator superfamily domain, general substrate transporter and Major facilitator superfamily associated domain-containing protein n=1 Tax=Strongyloides ratti TaxID=34506 RepID=A0A090LE54_STRRB|nr:Major facilitator superfamily and Major facilitator superfamily domain, general substrate transporter and Major facilitator superfamily associated domain-containing protein [Strongyloides ratti]CEF68037.1 Major facilitator superfamily and Major facilitator superfamily domain, general substrate transporter and Major facilitator superfamily associated domain-containing protein [Strongyloides ratti]
MIADSIGDDKVIRIFGREISRDIFMLKVFYLLYFASFGSLFPLLAVYFKQLGMTAAQAGLLLGSRPFIEFASEPFWGFYADKFKSGKFLLLFSLGSLVISTLAIGFVQPQTPYCVILDKNITKDNCMYLAAAGPAIKGGPLGLIKESVGLGRRKRRDASNQIIDTIIDLSSYDKEEDMIPGIAPEYITSDKVCNYEESQYGILLSPPHSSRVYREPAVEQAFMLLLLIILIGEFFSSPAIVLVDGITLSVVKNTPKMFGRVRLFGSIGWGVAMFIMGIGLDYSDTFKNHPCPIKNTTEKNYTICFLTCSLFTVLSMIVSTQLKFPKSEQQTKAEEIGGLVMDSRVEEVDPAIAQRTMGKQLHAPENTSETFLSKWGALIKASLNLPFTIYLLSIAIIGFGSGLNFSFLFWHLQDFGGSPTLFGLCSVVNHIAEVIMFFYSFSVINKYGYVKTMYGLLGANILRFLALSWLTNPWMVLPLQFVQGIINSLTWACASSYVSLVAPPHLKQQCQRFLALLFNGIARGCGGIIGGFIISYVGTRTMFQINALISIIILVSNYCINKLTKGSGFKYNTYGEFDDDGADAALAPHGIPLISGENNLQNAFNQTSVINTNYGTIGQDPQDEAYDRYVSNPYD